MSKKILLADDSITIQKVISITFAGEDFDLTIVGDGDEAISKVREVRPNLIMADVAMPGKSGYEVCEIVKTDPELKDIPVLLLAGTFEPINKEEAERVGMDDYIVKPFESQELIDKVKGLLERPVVCKPLQGDESVEAGISTAEERPTVAADIWEESDFVSPTQVEGAEQIGGGESEDIWSNTILEETVEEEQDEGIPKEEEFVEIDLSEEELTSISKEEETTSKLGPEGLEALEAEAVFVPESPITKEEIKELEEVEEIAEVEGPSMVSDAGLSETSEEEAVIGSEASEGEDMIEGVEAMEELEEPIEPFTPPATEPELEPEFEVVTETEPRVSAEWEPSIVSDTDATEPSEEEVTAGITAVEGLGESSEPFAPPATEPELEPAFEVVTEPEPQVSAELGPAIVSETEVPETIEEEVVVPPDISAVEEKIVEKTREVVAAEIAGNMSILKERIEEIVTRVSKEVIEEVAWEIIPDMVERHLKEEMRKIKEAIISLK